MPLVRHEHVNGKYTIADGIGKAWSVLHASKSPKYLRKTGASLLGGHRVYNAIARLYLGHSPTGIAEKHYVKPAQELLKEGLAWLRTQILD